MKQLTKEQSLIITGYTGISTGNFADFHEDVEKRLQRPVWTHEFGSATFAEQLKDIYREDFLDICYKGD